ncbi:MAG: hypothetical protein ABIW46_00245 [Acidimicrobiales bacterium]
MTLLSPTRTASRYVEELSFVDGPLALSFLEVYRQAFAPLARLAPARQGLTDLEFMEHMAQPSVVKFIAWDESGEPMAMAFMATDLNVVPWISPAYFEARFPDHFARGAVYYFGALLVSPGHQGGPWASLVLAAATRRVASAGAVAVFDCCEHNATRRLPQLIARAARRVSDLTTVELAPQRYFAYAQGLAAGTSLP